MARGASSGSGAPLASSYAPCRPVWFGVALSPWQVLATLRDLQEVGVPAPAIANKSVPERRRALVRASSVFAAYLRKRYTMPLTLVVTDVASSALPGAFTVEGNPTGSAADVKIEVVAGGEVSTGDVTVRVTREDGLVGMAVTPAVSLPASGIIDVDGVKVTIAGARASGDTLTYTAGPDPGIRSAVAALAAHALYYNRGADPKAMEPYKDARDQAIAYAKELCGGEGAELDEAADATPQRHEGGPMFTTNTRDGFLYGRT